MSVVPNGWQEVDLAEVVMVRDGRRVPLNQEQRQAKQGHYPYYGANGVVDHIDEYIFDGEYALLAEDGGYFDQPERGVAYQVSGKFWVNNHAHVLEPADGISSSFLVRWLNAIDWLPYVSGTTRLKLTQGGIQRVRMGLPPLAEQRRIVAKLVALDARTKRARADLDRIPALVARAKQAILAKAFRGELTVDWRDAHAEKTSQKHAAIRVLRQANPRLSRRQILAKTPDFSIPGNWAWISPDEVAADEKYSIGIGPFGSNLVKSDYREAGVRLVFVRDIRRESFAADDARYVEHKKASELYQHLARPGDVLITKMGDPPGDCCVFPLDAEPAIITADCIKLTPHVDLAESKYLNYCIRSVQVQSQFKGITAGVAQQKVSLERFRQLALPIAPLAEQAEIVRRIESAFAKIDRIAADAASASKLLGRLDQAILTKAFRGELVPQNPEDEPTSILLERIRATTRTAPRKGRGRKA